jgi:hypothetical protein
MLGAKMVQDAHETFHFVSTVSRTRELVCLGRRAFARSSPADDPSMFRAV